MYVQCKHMPKFWEHAKQRLNERFISEEEVEEIFFSKHVIQESRGKKLVYGKTEEGRFLLVVIVDDEIVTARDMEPNEKKNFKRRLK